MLYGNIVLLNDIIVNVRNNDQPTPASDYRILHND